MKISGKRFGNLRNSSYFCSRLCLTFYNQKKMIRKDYQIPAMKVVKLRQKCQILVVSNGEAGVQDYKKQDNYEE